MVVQQQLPLACPLFSLGPVPSDFHLFWSVMMKPVCTKGRCISVALKINVGVLPEQMSLLVW
jgi:hypothetical protein